MIKFKLPDKKTFLLLLAGYFIAILIVYLANRSVVSSSISSFFYLITFLVGGWTVWLDVQQFGLRHPQGKAFFLIFIGFCSATLGETAWFIQQIFQNFSSGATIASLFYLIGYILAFSGFIMEIISLKINWAEKYKFESKLIILGAIVIGFFVFKLEIYPLLQSNIDNTLKLLSLANGLGDLVSITLGAVILRIAVEYEGGLFFQPWFSIFIAQVIILVTGVLYVNFNTSSSNFFPFNLTNILFIAANLIAAFGFYGIYSSLKETQNNISELKKR